MKLAILFFLLFYVFYGQDFKETNLEHYELTIGETVPKINITDFISKNVDDEILQNKFLVIDFWATWCAPCLQSVPYFNSLQSKFKDNKNIAFISLSDESPKKIERILNRVSFETIVATDQTKQTQSNFKISGLPATVIVDKNNKVRWIGGPDQLTDETIKNIMDNPNWKPLSNETQNFPTEIYPEKMENDTTLQTLEELSELNSNIFTFSITYSNNPDIKYSNFLLPLGKYIDVNTSLKDILSKVTRKPTSEIIIPEDLAANNYNLVYVNKNISREDFDKEEFLKQLNIIKGELLTALNLEEKIEKRKENIYVLKVVDRSKLELGNGEISSHFGDNDNLLTFSNVEIETLIRETSKYHNVLLIDETDLKGKYDFLIDKNDFEKAKQDLKSYGLTMEKSTEEIEFNVYEKIN